MTRHVGLPLTAVLAVVGAIAGFGTTVGHPSRAAPAPLRSAPQQARSAWTAVVSPTGQDLAAVASLSERDIRAVGDNHTILHWDGVAWQTGSVRYDAGVLNSIAMVSATDGWAVGDYGAIRRWDGTTWGDVASPTSASLTGVAMVSPSDGWAVGWPSVTLRWDGVAWQAVDSPIGDDLILAAVALAASDLGWAVGRDGAILRWDGTAWSRIESPTTADLAGVAAVSRAEAWAVGGGGTILRWDGTRWSAVESPTEQDLAEVAMRSGEQGWAVGRGGVILDWDGRAWADVASPTGEDLMAVAVVGGSSACAVGRGGTILHHGAIRATATASATATATRRPTGTITPTSTPGPSPTPRPAATCPPGWQVSFELRLEPTTVTAGQPMTAHLTSDNFGFYDVTISLEMPGQRVSHRWRSESGYTSRAAVRFNAPSLPGRWTAGAFGMGEVAACVDGQIYWTHGSASTNSVPLTVLPAPLYVPLALKRVARDAFPPVTTAAPTSTPTASATPTATPSPTMTRTPAPGNLRFDGYVRDGHESGPGVPGVDITVSIRGTSMPPVTTESDGFYETPDYVVFVGDAWTVVPTKPGFTFAPPSASGVYRGFPAVARVDYVAFGGTASPPATSTTAPTPRAPLAFTGAPGVEWGRTTRHVAAGQDPSGIRFAAVPRVPVGHVRGVDAGPHQQATPTPSPSPEPPPVVCPTCPPRPSPHDAMMASDSVFQCTVTEVVNLGPEGDWDYRVTCPLDRYWTGCCPSSFYVPWSVWECGLVFRPGETWLVYTNRDGRGRDVIDHCSRTASYSDEEAGQLGQSCEPASIDVRPDRTAVRVGERFDVVIRFNNVMPLPEPLYADPPGLVDVVSEGWRQIDERSWYCERGGGGYGACGHVTMEARRPGTVLIGVSLYTEVCECDKGVMTCAFAGAGGNAPPVVISPAPLYVPLAFERIPREALPPARTAEPSSTPTTTATPTATPSPTSTRTPAPGNLRFDGYVRDGHESGPGVPGVDIAVSIRGTSMPPVTTESDGFYETPDYVVFAGDTWTMVPSKPGFTFAPPSASGVSRGFSIVERVDFVAFDGTAPPAATPTTAPTPRAALGFAGAPDGDRGETGRDVAAVQDESAVRFATVARVPVGDVRGVDAGPGLAVVTDAAFGLHVYDMRHLSAPVELGHAATVGTAGRVVVDGDVALVAHGEDSVSLYDLGDPTSPRRLSTLKLGNPGRALAARDGMGLVADDRDLMLFEYSTTTAPHEIGRLEMDFFGPAGVALSGDLAYVAQQWDRLRVVDIADPAHPIARGGLGESMWATGQSVAVDGARAYVGERLQGAYFIPSPPSPTPGPSPTGPRPPTVVPAPAATQPPDGGRLTVVDVSDPDAPQAIGSSDAFGYQPLTAIQADGDLVWAIAWPDPGWKDLVVLDVSDPTHPVPAKVEIEPPLAWNADPRDIAIEGDTVYIATREALVVLRRVREWSGTPAYLPLAGKPVAPPLDAEEGDAELVYDGKWESVADPDASGGAYNASSAASASLTVRFTGRSLALHRLLAPDGGTATLTLDGRPTGDMSFYFDEARHQVPAVLDNLGPGAHVLTIEVSDARPAGSSGSRVTVDRVQAPVPLEPPAAALAAFERANHYRTVVGLPDVRYDRAIGLAAQAHAAYAARNGDGAVESAGQPGFTGRTLADRLRYFGYAPARDEVMSTGVSPDQVVDRWMASVYHRLPLLDHATIDMGYGQAEDGPDGVVSIMDCGSRGHVAPLAREVHTFPPAGATGVPTTWDGAEERPPLPGASFPVGYPVSFHLTVGSGAAARSPGGIRLGAGLGRLLGAPGVPAPARLEQGAWRLEDWRLIGPVGPIPSHVIDVDSDPNHLLPPDIVFLIAVRPLSERTTYTAEVAGRDSTGVSFHHAWQFTTGERQNPE